MARNVPFTVALALVIFVAASPTRVDEDDDDDDDADSVASRTLMSATVFDGRSLATSRSGRILFRVRRIYKGWHVNFGRRTVTRLKQSDAAGRLIWIGCGDVAAWHCRLDSVVVGRRYVVFADAFRRDVSVHAAAAVGGGRRPSLKPVVGVYRVSGGAPVPLTPDIRRIVLSYSNLRFG